MYLGSWAIDNTLTFYANTTRFDTGAATDADSVPSYRVYEDETGTAILTGTMALLDSSNTAGFYSEQITLSAANGFEKGKSYAIYIQAAVNSVTGATHHTLQIEAEVDANTVSGTVGTVTTVTNNVNAVLANAAHGGAAAVLTLERVVVASATTNEPAISLTGNGTGAGMRSQGGTSGSGIEAQGGAANGSGIVAGASGNGNGIQAQAGEVGEGLYARGGATSGNGINAIAIGGGYGIRTNGVGQSGGADILADIQGNLSGTVGSLVTLDEDSTTVDLDATIRAAVGLASANLDTQLDALPTAAENASAAATAVAAIVIETGYDLAQTLQLIAAAAAAKLSGAATATNTFRSLDDSADRIVATVDSDGNRTAVTHNV